MLVLGTMAWASVRSQSPVSGVEYFQPGYSYRHLLNPAFVPLCGYVGIPVLGNLNASVGSNMGLSTLLYPLSDGSLGTFMHPEVDADAFMKKISFQEISPMGLDYLGDAIERMAAAECLDAHCNAVRVRRENLLNIGKS